MRGHAKALLVLAALIVAALPPSVAQAGGPGGTLGTTSAPDPLWPPRGIELINNPLKGGQNPGGVFTSTYLSPDRDRVIWSTLGGAPGSPSGQASVFIADRTPTGWRSKSLVPPIEQQVGGGSYRYQVVAAARDYSSFLVEAVQGIANEGQTYLLRLDDQGNQTVLQSLSGLASMDTSDDLKHVFSATPEPPVPGQAPGTTNLYDYGSGTPVLVGVLPDGSVPDCGVRDFQNSIEPDFYTATPGGTVSESSWVARDGSRAFFGSHGNDCGGPKELYLRDLDSSTTTLISGPPTSGSPAGAVFLRTNADASAALYVSATKLDPADINDTPDIYRWSDGVGNECLTCVVSDAYVEGFSAPSESIAASSDLSHIYFRSEKQLVPGEGEPGQVNLYVWHDGTIDYIAPATGETLRFRETRLSADGSVLVFSSSVPGTTPEDSGGLIQAYRYDDRDGSLDCITCPPGGADPAEPQVEDSLRMTKDGGTIVFQTSSPFVARDVNQGADLYEWHDGKVRLVTDGVTKFPFGPGILTLRGLSEDGTNALFYVGAKLTGYEVDQVGQLYTARIGGGFGRPPAAPVPCDGDSCQGPLVAPPPLDGSGSGVASAANSRPVFRQSKSRRQKKKAQRKRNHQRKRPHRTQTTHRHG